MPIVLQSPPEAAVQAVEAVLRHLTEQGCHTTPKLKAASGAVSLTTPHRTARAHLVHHDGEATIRVSVEGWRFLLERGGSVVAAASARPTGSGWRFADVNEGELVQAFATRLRRLQEQPPAGELEPIVAVFFDLRAVLLWLRPIDSRSETFAESDVVYPLYLSRPRREPERVFGRALVGELRELQKRTVDSDSRGG